MSKKSIDTYNPKLHDPIIEAVLGAGNSIINVASALGITSKRLVYWRRDNPELDKLINKLEQKEVSSLLEDYKNALKNGEEEDWRAAKLLKVIHNYNINHNYVYLPELILAKNMHERHDIIMHYVTNKLISLEQGEVLSKLTTQNADIYKMGELEKQIQNLEIALKSLLNREEL